MTGGMGLLLERGLGCSLDGRCRVSAGWESGRGLGLLREPFTRHCL
jgi:hypothetical protein